MSCNGCRVLRRGCGEKCILRPCLEWIQSPESQAHATLFVSKFFGRSDLMSFISAVPENRRPALFQSLLFEACGRTVNPVDGAVGLLTSGNWHLCQAAVDAVLAGSSIHPTSVDFQRPAVATPFAHPRMRTQNTTSSVSVLSEVSAELGRRRDVGREPKLLNLFR